MHVHTNVTPLEFDLTSLTVKSIPNLLATAVAPHEQQPSFTGAQHLHTAFTAFRYFEEQGVLCPKPTNTFLPQPKKPHSLVELLENTEAIST